MKRERFEKGLTVAELKRVIADWPDTDEHGEPCEVWLADATGASNQACTIGPLNARTSEDGKNWWADLMLQHEGTESKHAPPGWTNMTSEEVLECGDFPTQEARDRFRGEEVKMPARADTDPLP